MAIARGAGTEIIRSIHLEEVDSTDRILVFGVVHHIYTVLSVIVHCVAVATDNNEVNMYLLGYDSNAGTTARSTYYFRQEFSTSETYVWNDKFSFNGAEPANFTGPMDDATKQDAIADQGSTPVAQVLKIAAEAGGDNFDIHCTFIDQNNA